MKPDTRYNWNYNYLFNRQGKKSLLKIKYENLKEIIYRDLISFCSKKPCKYEISLKKLKYINFSILLY